MPFVKDKSKSKKGLQYLKDSPYSTEVQWVISDFNSYLNSSMKLSDSVRDLFCLQSYGNSISLCKLITIIP